MMHILRHWKIHPFLLAIYPLLGLASWNFTMVEWISIIRPLVVILLFVTFSFLFLSWLQQSFSRAALEISLSSVLFFFYPIKWLFQFIHLDSFFFLAFAVTACWVATWVICLWILIRSKKQFQTVTFFLNFISLALIGFLLIQMIWLNIPIGIVKQEPLKTPVSLSVKEINDQRPDIYYIILDSYTRDDLILNLFTYDNSQFSTWLQSQGFFIGRNSYSNYGTTVFSMASALNLSYLNHVPVNEWIKKSDYRIYRNLIVQNQVFQFLKQQGYEIITIESGYSFSELRRSDFYVRFKPHFNDLETMLLENSLAFFLIQDWNLSTKRARLLNSFESIQNLSQRPSPKFVLLHVMALHSPFLFDSNGTPIDGGGNNQEKYREQLMFLNQLLENTVSTILEYSEIEPVIILQGDHGPGGYDKNTDIGIECIEERFMIYNAIYLPPYQRAGLYEEISPVNIFRVVFNNLFDANLELLPDESYYSFHEAPINFSNPASQSPICDRVDK